jgi:hypothetical protein
MANVIIPSNPEERRKVVNALNEMSASFTRMDAERDLQKDILATLEEDFELPKKYMRKVARIYHKQNLLEERSNFQEVEDIYEGLMG